MDTKDRLMIAIPVTRIGNSGGHRVLAKLSTEWEKMGNKVTFIDKSGQKPYFPIKSKIIDVSPDKKYFGLYNCFKYLFKSFDKYDVILANYCLTAFPIFLASLLHGNFSKNYYYVQAYEVDFFPGNRLMRFLTAVTYKLPFKKIVNSDIYLNYKLCKSDIAVYPGLDLANYFPKDITKFSNGPIKIGTIGRTETWKGTATVCKAMELLKAEGIEFEFYIAFNDFETCEHHFVRPDGDENLAAFYRDMDIVIAACNGQFGAIHYPVIETMAVGSTIICTDYFPSNDSNAYKVQPDSLEEIVQAVKEVIADKETAIKKRQQALQDVQQFDWPNVAQKFLDYIHKTL